MWLDRPAGAKSFKDIWGYIKYLTFHHKNRLKALKGKVA